MTNSIIKPQPILIPNEKIDYNKWAVIACDQFGSQPKYWQQVEKLTKDSYSTYHLIFPEIYLKKDNKPIIERINAEMERYLAEGIFKTVEGGMILVERTTAHSGRRLGIVTSIDLEHYSFNNVDCPLIRASEGTILERIPPRLRIRDKARLELPHIMLLSDDKDNSAALTAYNDSSKKLLYDFELNMGGGHLRGYEIFNTKPVLEILDRLSTQECMEKSCKCAGGFAFAVGDGNHSLAAAKAYWNNLKKNLTEAERENHPARYALCEIVSLYDEGINFHPIHRVVYNVNVREFIKGLRLASGEGTGNCAVIYNQYGNLETLNIKMFEDPVEAIETVQNYIDEYKLDNSEIEVDYIHGEDALKEAVLSEEDTVGIIMPALEKSTFFSVIASRGVLPRKSFSIGEAEEKRYYFEAKIIK